MLQRASLIIRVSAGLEGFLDHTLQSMGGQSRLLTLADVNQSYLLAIRESLKSKPFGIKTKLDTPIGHDKHDDTTKQTDGHA